MAKKRRTRKQKRNVQNRRNQGEIIGFKISADDLGSGRGKPKEAEKGGKQYRSYLRADLTKTVRLTMLAVALELALWQFAFR